MSANEIAIGMEKILKVAKVHYIGPGDRVWDLVVASKHKYSLEDLQKLNPGKDLNMVRPGDSINIPDDLLPPAPVEPKGYDPVLTERLREHLRDLEGRHGFPTGLLAAIAVAESGGNVIAKSKSGAQGLMQLMPLHTKSIDPSDPFANATKAADVLLDAYKSSYDSIIEFGLSNQDILTLALYMYNYGTTNVRKVIRTSGADFARYLPAETQNYPRYVLSRSPDSLMVYSK